VRAALIYSSFPLTTPPIRRLLGNFGERSFGLMVCARCTIGADVLEGANRKLGDWRRGIHWTLRSYDHNDPSGCRKSTAAMATPEQPRRLCRWYCLREPDAAWLTEVEVPT
jgi:hypothetical protein